MDIDLIILTALVAFPVGTFIYGFLCALKESEADEIDKLITHKNKRD